MSLTQIIAADLADAPLSVYPIERLTGYADRDTVERILVGWVRAGIVLIDIHLDATVLIDRSRLAALATR